MTLIAHKHAAPVTTAPASETLLVRASERGDNLSITASLISAATAPQLQAAVLEALERNTTAP